MRRSNGEEKKAKLANKSEMMVSIPANSWRWDRAEGHGTTHYYGLT
jgi:hypothetical protein